MTDTRHKLFAEAIALRDARQAEQAIKVVEEYLATAPEDANGHALRGDLCRAIGAYNVAAASYEDALAYNPHHLQAHLGIADVLIQKGWLHSAVTVLENALGFAGESDDLRERYATAKARLESTAAQWRTKHPHTDPKH